MSLADYRVAIVTGARRGIGAATVRRLTARGLTVHAVSRDASALADLARETGCVVHGLDIADRTAVLRAFGECPADVLVNNAASPGAATSLAATDPDVLDTLLDANIRAPMNLLAAVVPGMATRGRGHVVNIGSMAGHHVIPGMPAYAATKAAIHQLCGNLRLDLHGTGVRVTEIVPGRVRTGIHLDMMADRDEAARRYYDGYETLESDDIAATIEFVLDAPQRMNVTLIEVLPTDQVVAGALYHKRG